MRKSTRRGVTNVRVLTVSGTDSDNFLVEITDPFPQGDVKIEEMDKLFLEKHDRGTIALERRNTRITEEQSEVTAKKK